MQSHRYRLVLLTLLVASPYSYGHDNALKEFDNKLKKSNIKFNLSHLRDQKRTDIKASSEADSLKLDYVDTKSKVIFSKIYTPSAVCALANSNKHLTINPPDESSEYFDHLTQPRMLPSCIIGRGLSHFQNGHLENTTFSCVWPDGTDVTADLLPDKNLLATKIERRSGKTLINTLQLSHPEQVNGIWIMTHCEITNHLANPVTKDIYDISQLAPLTDTTANQLKLPKGTAIVDTRVSPPALFELGNDKIIHPEELLAKSKKQAEKVAAMESTKKANPILISSALVAIALSTAIFKIRKSPKS